MTVTDFHGTVARCSNAPSDMALFIDKGGIPNQVSVYFADTFITQRRIRLKDSTYYTTIPANTEPTKAMQIIRKAFYG
ncbi:hypothetical protein J7384_17305 [Endozoicomonas sp. G2_1]|uniref:hypothetical protein n=1 Tax=Endozoicomonas sp. G2_1 TaxID=2821091 RepID=UPI001AD987D1|nr:hypothetical protein [Endozoicomonas sp. G2_1]MBO9492123.1 hypothetical protein [Endozoicomonas sp. G2_1]